MTQYVYVMREAQELAVEAMPNDVGPTNHVPNAD